MADIIECPACRRRVRVPPAAAGRPRCPACKGWLPWLVNADGGDFDAVAAQSPVPVLVDLWAPWCGPCRMVAPAVEQVARDLAGRLKVVKVNIDEAPAVAGRYSVQAVPTLLVLDGSREVARQVGAPPSPAALRTWVEEALSSLPAARP
ncbi:MAG: thioredoxin [Actinomycetota bacterium]|jgi:thioredoxin 2